ncbi:S1 family peptidase [Saccharothrix deserti]|uniref:S1 family peptidase n=1 Tax=Saccharothrix deserti TaxID=2593674 RepID=UPI00131B2310|nr:serine protease [Saccharothrix deserti]
MAAGQRRSSDDEQWRVRLVDTEGRTHGAGVQLGQRHVLTCAHVVSDIGDDVVVRAGSTTARAVGRHSVPTLPDGRGDVALLELDRELPGDGAVLSRAAVSWDRAVHVFGFPEGVGDGVYARTVLAGRAGPGSEWIQMNARSGVEQRVRRGFSGSGVVDEQTGAVLGIVVSEYKDKTQAQASLSWMIPVETILSHLPEVDRWVTGESAADEVFSGRAEAEVSRVGVAKALADWLARGDRGDVVITVVGADRRELYRLVALSDRESRLVAPDAPEGTVPAVGSIDLAVDASGRTADEVARRIVRRVGIAVDERVGSSALVRAGIPPMTVAVDGVDEAVDPDELLNGVLRPLAEHGTRLILGFRHESSPSLAAAWTWEVDQRLDDLTRVVVRRGGDRAARLRQRVTELRIIASRLGPAEVRPRLEEFTREVAAIEADADPGDVPRELHEQEKLLGVYLAKAVKRRIAERADLVALHRTATGLLRQSPPDLDAVKDTVLAYALAVRREERA